MSSYIYVAFAIPCDETFEDLESKLKFIPASIPFKVILIDSKDDVLNHEFMNRVGLESAAAVRRYYEGKENG